LLLGEAQIAAAMMQMVIERKLAREYQTTLGVLWR
jgi:hypothetical protein